MDNQKDTKTEDSEEQEKINETIKDLEYKWKRALADYQNLQKETAKEKAEFVKFANSALLMEILPVYENLKTSLEHADENNHDAWLKGIKHVIKQFENILKDNGVQIINPVDSEFNPAEHEAVEKTETEDEKLNNKIAKVVKIGYKLQERVVQPAKVVVYIEKITN
ncbi:nucleotide exchange factor GrpE [Candidatus Falkowbacteria bacterium CG10_big_fil_rev_8_21_14_0_10_44_15]|uniref:Protein GrpE n=1 Tax=Candidatus Falkowbacteria bacterium CG10_big_fil_rev_8_21_14_0_10_44_15 TaxID=1974569 RepID=A0A2H0V0J3_9BACT|nr:MAG: nucleotide exchange factor GrpE [Candidatus Falkowbacteria bacterium CG10_big_fil_rev_8_21_14_0_10_44_15]